MTIEELLPHLHGVRPHSTGRLSACCPAHEDRNPSLSIREGERAILVKCWAGCTIEEITRAMGLEVRNLFFDENPDPGALHQARAQRQAEQMWRRADSHVAGLEVDSRREAQRLIERARNLDISEWTDAQLTLALDDLAAAHHRLQVEGPAYYDFTLNL